MRKHEIIKLLRESEFLRRKGYKSKVLQTHA